MASRLAAVNPEERRLMFASDEHNRAVDRRRDAQWLREQWAKSTNRVLVVNGSEIEVDPVTGDPLWLTPRSAPDGEHYLLGVNEGHGFQKKENRDYYTAATMWFLDQELKPRGAPPG